MQPGRRVQYQGGSIVKPLLWANIIVFIFTSFGAMGNPLMGLLWLRAPEISRLELWRLGTYMFVHAGFGHIFFNMWGLYIFGRPLELRLGGSRFLNLYMISGLVGGIFWLLFNWEAGGYPVVGASGAVFGVMMAAAMAFPNQQIMLLFPPIPMRLKTFVFAYGTLEVILALTVAEGGGIAHIAHLGGILGGFIYMRRLTGMRGGFGNLFGPLAAWWRRTRADKNRSGFRMVPKDEYEDEDEENLSAEVDRILDKIGRHGLSGLTEKEKKKLERARQRLKKR